MSTLIGNAAKPNGAGGWEAWSSTWNMAAETLTMPEDGRIVSVGCWAAGVNETATAYLAIWDSATGAQLGESAAIVLASETPASGHVSLYVAELLTPVELDAGATFLAGFWRTKAKSHQLTGRGTGTHLDKLSASRTSFAPPRNSGGHAGDYSVGIHAYYDPTSGAWTRRAGATVRAQDVFTRRGGGWASPDRVATRRGGAWIDAE